MKAIDWTKLFQKYKGLWVALKSDQKTVVASGSDIVKVKKDAEKKGYPDPIFYKVPTKIAPFIG